MKTRCLTRKIDKRRDFPFKKEICMEKENKEEINKDDSIKIDYEKIDVADIMDQIKKKIAKKRTETPAEQAPSESPVPFSPPPFPPEPEMEPQALGLKGKIKKILLKIMKPFAPAQKLLALPVHQELMETVRKLHQTNQRLEYLNARMDYELRKLSENIGIGEKRLDLVNDTLNTRLDYVSKTTHERIDEVSEKTHLRIDEVNDTVNARLDYVSKTTHERIDEVSEKTNLRIDEVNEKANIRYDRALEYIKLLHNLSHNLVVELSKLRIEEENLKLKARIIEKDFEFLSRKEKALEKEFFK
jgi:hypothetical protein